MLIRRKKNLKFCGFRLIKQFANMCLFGNSS